MNNTTHLAYRPRPGDWARSVAYLVGIAWALTFLSIPPAAFADGVSQPIRAAWMGITIIGGTGAVAGSMLGIDLKLELPAIGLLTIGPVVYGISQIFLVVNGVAGREAIAVFALFTVSLLMPRAVELISASRRAKKDALR